MTNSRNCFGDRREAVGSASPIPIWFSTNLRPTSIVMSAAKSRSLWSPSLSFRIDFRIISTPARLAAVVNGPIRPTPVKISSFNASWIIWTASNAVWAFGSFSKRIFSRSNWSISEKSFKIFSLIIGIPSGSYVDSAPKATGIPSIR